MDPVQIFNDELQSLLDVKPPVSKAKMGMITRAAMKGVKFYKHIVLSVEKFIAKCKPEYKVPGLYVIDSIVRQSRHQFGIERDVYAVRFSRNLPTTFEYLFAGCSLEDKSKIVRVLNLWQKNGVFNPQTLEPLFDMAKLTPGSSIDQSNISASSPASEGNSKSGQNSGYHYDHTQLRQSKMDSVSLKFTKNMLDFDYDEDDEDNGDETPTEAEPPLSSTLSKIEMEQRSQQRISVGTPSIQTSQTQHHHNAINHQTDPVLERWNRLIRGESSADLNDSRTRRSRSRSPPQSSIISSKINSQVSSNSRDFNYKPPVQLKNEIPQAPPVDPAKEAEKAAEREKKCLPKVRDKHLTVCSSTLWLGHVPKTVSEADISNAFGEYGTITSIDLIPPRGCAYVCMDRRQDAKRALNESKDLKLNGSHIKMAWAPGKGFKEYKKLKDFWEVETGSSFIPYSKIDENIDFDTLEEGGVIDEDSMSLEMREMRERKQKEKEQAAQLDDNQSLPMPCLPLMNQPPPTASIAPFAIPAPSISMSTNMAIPPPSALSQGMIHFPPPTVPIVTTTPNPSMMITASSNIRLDDNHDSERVERSPSNIDHQLSMTEKQISMIEQQLNMIKQAQTVVGPQAVSQANAIPHLPHPPIFNHQPPLMYDMPLQSAQIPGAQPMLDPNIFVNPAQLICHNPMIPISQASMMDPANLHNPLMQHQQGRF